MWGRWLGTVEQWLGEVGVPVAVAAETVAVVTGVDTRAWIELAPLASLAFAAVAAVVSSVVAALVGRTAGVLAGEAVVSGCEVVSAALALGGQLSGDR